MQTVTVGGWRDSVADPMTPQIYRVQANHVELPGVFTLSLRAENDAAECVFEPGQFNMLYAFGMGEVPISISGDPAHPSALLHTLRAVGSVTEALQRLTAGAGLGIRGPFGNHWPAAAAEGADVVILAGGIGLAPLRPLIYRLLARRERYGAICIFYGARNPNEILYLEELEHWRSRFDLTVEVTVDRAGADWRGKVGMVTKLLGQKGFSATDSMAFLCGPEIMMRYAVLSLNELGVNHERIFVSMERNMKCALGFCGHCQYGAAFVCKDGPIFRFDRIADRFNVREI